MRTLAERVAEALAQAQETAPYKNKAGLAKHCGIRPSSVTDWFSGKTKTIGYRHAVRAAEYLQVNAAWLADGTGEMKSQSVQSYEDIVTNGNKHNDPDLIVIPQYQIRASAGPGSEALFDEITDKSEGIIKPRSWFQANHINPDNCKCFRVYGDSMEPFLWDGDKILVDCTFRDIISGKVYVFMIRGEMRVKVLRPLITGGIVVRSFNPEIPDETLSAEDLDTFEVIGRVRDREGNSWL